MPTAGRFVRLLPNAIAVSSVSIDTGTLSASAVTATMTANGFTAPAFVNFKLSDPGLRWEVIVSTSSSTFYPEVFHRYGVGDSGRNVGWNGINERIFPNQFVPPGVYFVKISVEGGSVVDQTLRLYIAPDGLHLRQRQLHRRLRPGQRLRPRRELRQLRRG